MLIQKRRKEKVACNHDLKDLAWIYDSGSPGFSSLSTTSQSAALAKLLHFSTQFIHQLDMNN